MRIMSKTLLRHHQVVVLDTHANVVSYVKGVKPMIMLNPNAHINYDHLMKEATPMFDSRPHRPSPIPPHERKALMRVEFDETDWNTLQEVFGDNDSASAAVSIILDSPPEIQILAAQIINLIQKEVA